ncbi:ATP-binding protein [Streptomyces sp. 4N124]|uniref:ATP-binding protein n=1 Tax=Streptomyces sp. 4N124 TaxID=3457420 RepID=UPI003FD185AE
MPAPDLSRATWRVAADPAAVADARRWAVARLGGWGLAEAVPTTELIVSELVTNAIRHAHAPITLGRFTTAC